MVRLKLRTCSTSGISMKPSRRAQAVTSHSLIIVREFDLMQGIEEADHGNVEHLMVLPRPRRSSNDRGSRLRASESARIEEMRVTMNRALQSKDRYEAVLHQHITDEQAFLTFLTQR